MRCCPFCCCCCCYYTEINFISCQPSLASRCKQKTVWTCMANRNKLNGERRCEECSVCGCFVILIHYCCYYHPRITIKCAIGSDINSIGNLMCVGAICCCSILIRSQCTTWNDTVWKGDWLWSTDHDLLQLFAKYVENERLLTYSHVEIFMVRSCF